MSTPRRVHKSICVTTGVGICTYFANLFQANELSPKVKKLTDEQIAILVEKEFPNRPTAKVYRGQSKRRTINEYRQRYHNGKFTGGDIPSVFSFRYDKDGDEVDGRTGKYKLPAIQVTGLASAQRYWAERQRTEQKSLGQPSIKEQEQSGT
jgi:hypothetical protein